MKKILTVLLLAISAGAFAAGEATIPVQAALSQNACDSKPAYSANGTADRLLLAQRDIGQCMGACASEQGICIGQCQGNGQCISNCAAAHGRCVARCN